MSDIVKRLRALANALAMGEWIALTETCATAADEIERLRAERDEARRETCYELSGWKQSTHEQEARAEAKRRGWDCFRENP